MFFAQKGLKIIILFHHVISLRPMRKSKTVTQHAQWIHPQSVVSTLIIIDKFYQGLTPNPQPVSRRYVPRKESVFRFFRSVHYWSCACSVALYHGDTYFCAFVKHHLLHNWNCCQQRKWRYILVAFPKACMKLQPSAIESALRPRYQTAVLRVAQGMIAILERTSPRCRPTNCQQGYCPHCKSACNARKHWKFDLVAPTIISGVTHFLTSIHSGARLPLQSELSNFSPYFSDKL